MFAVRETTTGIEGVEGVKITLIEEKTGKMQTQVTKGTEVAASAYFQLTAGRVYTIIASFNNSTKSARFLAEGAPSIPIGVRISEKNEVEAILIRPEMVR